MKSGTSPSVWSTRRARALRLAVDIPHAAEILTVYATLTELQACTHLNDMMRCLTEVPALAAAVAATA